MKKWTILKAIGILLFSGMVGLSLPALADDQTTVDPASEPPGDNATNYSDSNNNSQTAPDAAESDNDADQNIESGITPDIATGDDDY